MVYLIIIVVFFFLSFFSFPFILLASRFLSHLSSSLRVFFPFISYKFRAKPLFFCLFSSLSPFPVRHFPSFVSANLGGWEIPLRIPSLVGAVLVVLCAPPPLARLRLRRPPLSLPCRVILCGVIPSLMGRAGVGLFILFFPIYLHMSNIFCTFASSKTSISPVLYT